jgi:hypothetical protein
MCPAIGLDGQSGYPWEFYLKPMGFNSKFKIPDKYKPGNIIPTGPQVLTGALLAILCYKYGNEGWGFREIINPFTPLNLPEGCDPIKYCICEFCRWLTSSFLYFLIGGFIGYLLTIWWCPEIGIVFGFLYLNAVWCSFAMAAMIFLACWILSKLDEQESYISSRQQVGGGWTPRWGFGSPPYM